MPAAFAAAKSIAAFAAVVFGLAATFFSEATDAVGTFAALATGGAELSFMFSFVFLQQRLQSQ